MTGEGPPPGGPESPRNAPRMEFESTPRTPFRPGVELHRQLREDTEMNTLKTPRLLRLGDARRLTRAVMDGQWFEPNSSRHYVIPPGE